MPRLLRAVMARPPAVFTIQTRGPLIERDIALLIELNRCTLLRISFSVTTNDDRVSALYEPHCDPNSRRLATIRRLREAGIAVHATLAPILPCDPETLAELAISATDMDLIGDPFHVRSVKTSGATTREQARRIAEVHQHLKWFDPPFQNEVVERIRNVAERYGRQFAIGTEGFSWLART
jgi:DNA repair photolyase